MANRVTRLIAQLLFRAWPTVVASGYPEASYLTQIYQKPCQETPFSFLRQPAEVVRPGWPRLRAEPRDWQQAKPVLRSCRINVIARCPGLAPDVRHAVRRIEWVRCRKQNIPAPFEDTME